ncbi:unnamed protein product [Symbiodinium sp. CCMP2592]|nr:unnamed protein product [Symbiodinium sp. CCMP2592]
MPAWRKEGDIREIVLHVPGSVFDWRTRICKDAAVTGPLQASVCSGFRWLHGEAMQAEHRRSGALFSQHAARRDDREKIRDQTDRRILLATLLAHFRTIISRCQSESGTCRVHQSTPSLQHTSSGLRAVRDRPKPLKGSSLELTPNPSLCGVLLPPHKDSQGKLHGSCHFVPRLSDSQTLGSKWTYPVDCRLRVYRVWGLGFRVGSGVGLRA